MAVQLIIKSASHNLEDFKLDCEMTWTVRQVKDQIEKSYPTKPMREIQKLIYGGKLLPDHLPLSSILNASQEIHILHLVYFLPPYKKGTPEISNQGTATACTVPPSGAIYPQVNQQIVTSPILPNATVMGAGVFPLNTPADVVNQYLAMQQMYAQFMTQYFLQYNNAVTYGQVPVTPTPAQQPPVQQRNVNQNDNVDNQPPNDIIDVLYIFTRAVVLFLALYYYSSLQSVICVCLLFIFVSLLKKLNKDYARIQQAENRLPQNNGQEPENDNSETPSEDPSAESQSNPALPSSSIQSSPSIQRIIFNAVSTFFTSMVPEPEIPVNAN